MAQTVIGIFDSASEAQNAKQQLISNGFSETNVDIASGNASEYTNKSSDHDRENEGGIARFFRNLFGGDDDQSERYTRVAERGTVVTVHAQDEDEADRAADLLDDYGAVDVDENYRNYNSNDSDSSWGSGPGTGGMSTGTTGMGGRTGAVVSGTPMGDTYVETDRTTSGMVNDRAMDGDLTTRSGGIFDDDTNVGTRADNDTDGGIFDRDNNRDTDRDTDRDNDRGLFGLGKDRDRDHSDTESRKIQIIEENINVSKREVETGGVRLRSRIVERPVEEHLRLREEHVRVERNAVDREATSADIDSFNEETIELRERSEVPVISKDARVVEEVSLDKEVEHRDETITDTVRRTEVDVEELEGDRRNRNNDNV